MVVSCGSSCTQLRSFAPLIELVSFTCKISRGLRIRSNHRRSKARWDLGQLLQTRRNQQHWDARCAEETREPRLRSEVIAGAPTIDATTLPSPRNAAPTIAALTIVAPTIAAPTIAAPTIAAPTVSYTSGLISTDNFKKSRTAVPGTTLKLPTSSFKAETSAESTGLLIADRNQESSACHPIIHT